MKINREPFLLFFCNSYICCHGYDSKVSSETIEYTYFIEFPHLNYYKSC